jgi:hypothetical protein
MEELRANQAGLPGETPPAPAIVDYAPAPRPHRGAWWLAGEIIGAAVLLAIATAVFFVGASFWWGGPTGQLRGLLRLAAIMVPMAIGAGVAGWVVSRLVRCLGEYRGQ